MAAASRHRTNAFIEDPPAWAARSYIASARASAASWAERLAKRSRHVAVAGRTRGPGSVPSWPQGHAGATTAGPPRGCAGLAAGRRPSPLRRPDAHHLHAWYFCPCSPWRGRPPRSSKPPRSSAPSDASGAVIADAKVTLTGLDTGVAQTRVADATGTFEFFNVRIGTYVGDRREGGLLHRPGRQRPGHRRRAPARRLTMRSAQLTETVEVTRRPRRAGDRHAASAARSSPASRRARCRSTAASTRRWRCCRPASGCRRSTPAASRRARARSTSTACAAPSTTS